MLNDVNQELLRKPDRDWDRTPPYASSPAKPSSQETPDMPTPVLDEAFYLKHYKSTATWAAYNIKVCGGNAEDLRALIDSNAYWETETLHYTALLRKHLDQATDVVSYWRQEAARQKEVLALRVSLTKYRAGDQPEDVGPPIQLDEAANCTREKREALYYTAIIHKHLDQAVDALPYWKEEAAYQRKALTEWVPSFKDCEDSFLRRGIDQLGYWREEAKHLHPISKRMLEKLRRDREERRESIV